MGEGGEEGEVRGGGVSNQREDGHYNNDIIIRKKLCSFIISEHTCNC